VRGIEIGKIEMPVNLHPIGVLDQHPADCGVGDLRERRLLYVAMTRT
jgi:superfamily I DNA/RNA helicase